MAEPPANITTKAYGSEVLNNIVQKLGSTREPKKRYEYVLWLGKKLPSLPLQLHTEEIKVKGCVSEVYVLGELFQGRFQWKGYSDALITKGLLALLVEALKNLTPEEVIAIDPSFIEATGLKASLTPSRANGFLNILLAMQAQAQAHMKTIS